MNHKFFFISLLFTIATSLNAQNRSIIGSYWTGLSYTHENGDDYDSNGIALEGNLAFLSNLSLELELGYKNWDIDSGGDEDGITGLVGILFHNKFNAGNAVTFDPFISLSSGFYNRESTVVPVKLLIGSEIIFSDFFALTPHIGVEAYLDDNNLDLDTLFLYGLAGNFLITDHFSLGLSIAGDSESTFSFGVHTRLHF